MLVFSRIVVFILFIVDTFHSAALVMSLSASYVHTNRILVSALYIWHGVTGEFIGMTIIWTLLINITASPISTTPKFWPVRRPFQFNDLAPLTENGFSRLVAVYFYTNWDRCSSDLYAHLFRISVNRLSLFIPLPCSRKWMVSRIMRLTNNRLLYGG